jgi:hypothetical protein
MTLPQRGSASDPIDLEASAHDLPLTANTTTSMGGKVGGYCLPSPQRGRFFISINAFQLLQRSRVPITSTTLLHELTHWTGHKLRLDRDLKGPFGERAVRLRVDR